MILVRLEENLDIGSLENDCFYIIGLKIPIRCDTGSDYEAIVKLTKEGLVFSDGTYALELSESFRSELTKLFLYRALRIEIHTSSFKIVVNKSPETLLYKLTNAIKDIQIDEATSLKFFGSDIIVSNPKFQWEIQSNLQDETINFFRNKTSDSEYSKNEYFVILVRILCALGFAKNAKEEVELQPWNAYELSFHLNTRVGFTQIRGATYPGRGKIPSPEPYKTYVSESLIKKNLPSPKEKEDSDFFATLNSRRSSRKFSNVQLRLKQLSEVLFRSCRIKKMIPVNEQILTLRPFPSSGGCYEIEVYLLALNVEGLAQGLYHYDPSKHVLTQLSELNEHSEKIKNDTNWATGANPQCILQMTSKIGNLAYKYKEISYSLTLKNFGSLAQTISLVAENVGLGTCIVGTGDSIAFSELAGVDIHTEPLIGEMIIGEIET